MLNDQVGMHRQLKRFTRFSPRTAPYLIEYEIKNDRQGGRFIYISLLVGSERNVVVEIVEVASLP